jgi:tetratricopeptide (TPR) repeat protein
MRISAQLVDASSGFPLWSERFDRETRDVFQLQDEIAGAIAEALRIRLTPEERAEIAAKPTEDPLAYDLYLRGRALARRLTRQDLEFALQMFEDAVAKDPGFALAHAAIGNVYARYHYIYARDAASLENAREASERAVALEPELPEAKIAQGWILYAGGSYPEAIATAREVVAANPDCEGAYYLLLRALFGSGHYEQVVEIAEAAIASSDNDYNVFVPITNAFGALGRLEEERAMRQRRLVALQAHLRQVPEDARARILLAGDYATERRDAEAIRELELAMVLRPNESVVLYNAACTYCALGRKAEALDALVKAWAAGFRDADWVRRDPDLVLLHGESEFERLYPPRD